MFSEIKSAWQGFNANYDFEKKNHSHSAIPIGNITKT